MSQPGEYTCPCVDFDPDRWQHRRAIRTTRRVRNAAGLDHPHEPDIVHDLSGHVPPLLDPVLAAYVAAYGGAGVSAGADGAIERSARLHWHTVEFGAIDPAGVCASMAPASSLPEARVGSASTAARSTGAPSIRNGSCASAVGSTFARRPVS